MDGSTVFETMGNVELLSQRKLALFASRKAEKIIYDSALELFLKLCTLPITLTGGWQAPLEKYLIKHIPQNVQANFAYYLAKDINQFQPTDFQRRLIEQQKLLIIAPGLNEKRSSSNAVKKRDELLFAQVSKILFLYVEKNGRLERYFRQLSGLNYQFYFLDHPLNQSFMGDDVVALNAENVADLIFS
jgi:hypothetical protein